MEVETILAIDPSSHTRIVLTDRTTLEYSHHLGIDVTKLEGNILDLGTGQTPITTCGQLFRTTLNIEGVSSDGGVVIADGLALPYPSKLFNTALCLWSVPYHFKSKVGSEERMQKTAELTHELYRVLCEGGTAYLYPVIEDDFRVITSFSEFFDIKSTFLHRIRFEVVDKDRGVYRMALTKRNRLI